MPELVVRYSTSPSGEIAKFGFETKLGKLYNDQVTPWSVDKYSPPLTA